ncbi:hypothetical protein EVAR_67331_1 [Eumeta japonica]|uniref:Uncharacterized protein n=1 Tax=Eumeta variegata TaxID=151549 RepID=A0A4C1ZXB5_EUMVA|nr:hypothetical protein EVAR_67331_1 [Eumeta japonica]
MEVVGVMIHSAWGIIGESLAFPFVVAFYFGQSLPFGLREQEVEVDGAGQGEQRVHTESAPKMNVGFQVYESFTGKKRDDVVPGCCEPLSRTSTPENLYHYKKIL